MPARISTSPASPSARSSAAASCRAATCAAGDVVLALASSGVHSNGFSLVRKLVADAGLGWDDPAPVRQPPTASAQALLDADAHLCEAAAGGDRRRPARSRPWRISPAAASPRTCRACCPQALAARIDLGRAAGAAGLPLAGASWRDRAEAKCCAPSIAASAWCWSCRSRPAAAVTAALSRGRRDGGRRRRDRSSAPTRRSYYDGKLDLDLP